LRLLIFMIVIARSQACIRLIVLLTRLYTGLAGP
jgi:hypothetical protein